MTRISQQVVDCALEQLREGRSTSQVSKELGISISSAIRIRKKDKENIPEPNVGRPLKISKSSRRLLARHFNTGELRTLDDGKRFVKSVKGEQIHSRTVRRYLEKEGLRAYVQQKKPHLTPNHRSERLEFACRHLNWTIEQWREVMFSDESLFSRFGSFGKKFYYSDKAHKSFQPHQIQETKRGGGGKLMVWGCMTYYGVGDAVETPGKINSDEYLDTLDKTILQSRDWYNMNPSKFIFQHDNSSVHTAFKVKKWFLKKKITVLKWPPNSPDLNPIENIWCYIKSKLCEYPDAPKSLDELWTRVEEIWVSIPIEFIRKLYESMPQRIKMVQKNRGGHTTY